MKHSIKNYEALLQKISHAVGLKVYLAGGALRDLLLNRVDQIQDLDLWVHTDDILNTRSMAQSSGVLGDLRIALGNSESSIGRNGDICAIDYYEKDGQEIQLIYLRKPIKDVKQFTKTFDFTVNQVCLDYTTGLFKTPHFIQDTKDKILRLVNADNEKRSLKRIAKMTSKFPDWLFLKDIKKPSLPSFLSPSPTTTFVGYPV